MGDVPTTSTSGGPCATQTTATAVGATLAMVHISTSDGLAKLYCPLCNKALISLQGYAKHIKKHEPPGGFLCRYCPATFCSDDELKQHRNAVHTIIACRICKDTTFNTESDYREHIRVAHNGVDRELYKCNKCGAEYKTLEPYQRHMNTNCGTIKPYKCDECSMSFVTKYNLKQHKETHTGERKFCCSYCGKNFLQKGRLVEHERSHTGEKPYRCDVCGKCFAHRESIVTHSSLHTGIRLVECKCCQSRFSCYSNLLKHRRARPDTCGQPAYDPPKHRVRQHTSRIPATLNPTSEIRVCNVNKIIKPTDAEQLKKATKKSNAEVLNKPAFNQQRCRRGGYGANRSTVGRRKRKKIVESEDELSSNDNDDVIEEDTTELHEVSKPQTRYSWANEDNRSNNNNNSRTNQISTETDNDEDDDCIVYDPHENSDESDTDTSNLVTIDAQYAIKREQSEVVVLPVVAEESDLIYTSNEELNTVVKSEEDIFKQKDKLIDCLLNDDHSEDERDKLTKQNEQILEETEIILIKDQQANVLTEDHDLVEVDALALQDLKADMEHVSCTVQLVDIRRQYPKLKSTNSIKFTVTKGNRLHKTLTETKMSTRKTRKHTIDDSKTPKRVAKIKKDELKKRLDLLKRDVHTYSCPHCIKIYHMRKPFENHLRDDHQLPEEAVRNILKNEEFDAVGDEVFKCDICEKIYLIEKRLIAHMKLHGPDRNLIYKCPCYCNLYFASKEEATEHAHQVHRDIIYCELCNKFMKRGLSLKSHMRTQHSDIKTERAVMPRNFVCEKCGKKFSGRTPLSDHVRSDCGRKPIYACHICGKHLTTAGILKTHMLLHKDETPYQCEHCGKTFKVKAQYKTHLKVRHTEDKPFKCHLCPKAYPYRESLLTHMTVHTGIKRFLCNGCGKRFTCISNLQAHRKVQADTCGQLPLNAKATQYMGVQKGNLLLGAKPEAGVDYQETNTLIAKEVLDRNIPMAQKLNYPSDSSTPLPTVALHYTPPALLGIAEPPQTIELPQIDLEDVNQQYIEEATHSDVSYN